MTGGNSIPIEMLDEIDRKNAEGYERLKKKGLLPSQRVANERMVKK